MDQKCVYVSFSCRSETGGAESKRKPITKPGKLAPKRIRESGWSKNENLSKLFVGGTARHFSHKHMYLLHDNYEASVCLEAKSK